MRPYSHYKLAILLEEEEEEDKKKRYNLLLSNAAFIPLLRRKRVLALSLTTLAGLLEVLIPVLVVGAFGVPLFMIFFLPTPVIPASAATVSILPMSITQQETYTITAITGNPNRSEGQVFACMVAVNTTAVSETVNATGQGTILGTQASGTLRVENHDASNPLTLNSGTVFPNQSPSPMINMQLDETVTLAPGGFTGGVPAHVVEVGTIGNLPSACCGLGPNFQNQCNLGGNCGQAHDIFNDAPFTGGTDPQTYSVVQQSDMDSAAKALISANSPDAQQVLQGQVQPNEQFIGTPQCNPNTSANQSVGDQVSQVTVTVSFSCSGEVYDYDGALTLAQDLLKQYVQQSYPNIPYALAGTIATTMLNVALTDANSGTVTMTIFVSGPWVAQFDTKLEQTIAQAIAGKTKVEAQKLLNNWPDIKMASIQLQGGNSDMLPTQTVQITFIVQSA